MRDESPFEAVERVLRRHDVTPNNVMVMMLIDAVRETTPAPREMTIGLLRKVLAGLAPDQALEGWANRSAREITKLITKHVRADDERVLDMLEGTIEAMLLRVTRGEDLT